MKFWRMLVLASILVLSAAADALAVPILFSHRATGTAITGSIGGVGFVTSDVLITATGDTSARQSFGTGFWIDHLTATVAIQGVGSFSFVSPTRTFVNNSSDTVGFSRGGPGGLDLLNGPTNVAFDLWDMLSSIGPIVGSGSFLQWTSSPVNTSGGVLVFTSQPTTVTFIAQVPEPATLGLLGLGLATALLRRKRD